MVARVGTLNVNKYSRPEDNILIWKDNCKGVSLYRERINCQSFSKYESFLEDISFKPLEKEIEAHHSEVKGLTCHTFQTLSRLRVFT